MRTIIISILSGVIAAYFTAYFVYRRDRYTFIEKWMNQLRDEVSKYLGLCEQLRLGSLDTNLFDTLYGDILVSMYKIELLLNRVDEDKITQQSLLQNIKALRDIIHSHSFKGYIDMERSIVDDAYSILDEHWKIINSEFKYIKEVRKAARYFLSLVKPQK
ncbi:MAG: hypothetical protein ACLP2P_12710 [Desulfobaccales bacterium]